MRLHGNGQGHAAQGTLLCDKIKQLKLGTEGEQQVRVALAGGKGAP